MPCRHIKRELLLWLACASFVAPSAALAGGQDSFTARQWTVEKHLPQNTVRCLVQSRDGYIWIGTRMGLARFDGARFTVFSRATNPMMANDNCVALAEDSDGAVWIGTEGGLLKWKDHRFALFAADEHDLSH